MKKAVASLVLALAMIAVMLPVGAWAKKPEEIKHYKERLDDERVTVSGRTIRVNVEGLYVGNVSKVLLDDEELMSRFHYKTKRDKDTNEVVITIQQSYLNRWEPGKYPLRVEFLEHSYESTYVVEETDGGYTTQPPRVKRTTG